MQRGPRRAGDIWRRLEALPGSRRWPPICGWALWLTTCKATRWAVPHCMLASDCPFP